MNARYNPPDGSSGPQHSKEGPEGAKEDSSSSDGGSIDGGSSDGNSGGGRGGGRGSQGSQGMDDVEGGIVLHGVRARRPMRIESDSGDEAAADDWPMPDAAEALSYGQQQQQRQKEQQQKEQQQQQQQGVPQGEGEEEGAQEEQKEPEEYRRVRVHCGHWYGVTASQGPAQPILFFPHCTSASPRPVHLVNVP
jgi:hypothetical protein